LSDAIRGILRQESALQVRHDDRECARGAERGLEPKPAEDGPLAGTFEGAVDELEVPCDPQANRPSRPSATALRMRPAMREVCRPG
jgi:hypothetical protein